MAIPEEYDFYKLAREITAARLKDAADAPAAKIACQIIGSCVPGTRQRQDPRLSVKEACRGVMAGLLLLDKDLAAASVDILQSMAHLAQEIHLDPADMMTWAMEGIAQVAVLGSPDLKLQIREAIEEKFMGTGEIFGALCEKARGGRAP